MWECAVKTLMTNPRLGMNVGEHNMIDEREREREREREERQYSLTLPSRIVRPKPERPCQRQQEFEQVDTPPRTLGHPCQCTISVQHMLSLLPPLPTYICIKISAQNYCLEFEFYDKFL